MHSLLQASAETEAFAASILGQQNYICDAKSLERLPQWFGRDHLTRILDLSIEMTWVDKHDAYWPDWTKIIAEDLRNLDRLEVWRSYKTSEANRPYPEDDSGDPSRTVTRHDQEARAVIKFACFIVPYHPRLRRVIRPASSGMNFEIGEVLVTNRVVVDCGYHMNQENDRQRWETIEKWKDGSRQERVTTEVSARFTRFNAEISS